MLFGKGWTMVEVLVVVLIVAILAAIAVPHLGGRTDSSRWAEAKTAMGSIAAALRTYAAREGDFSVAPTFSQLEIRSTDLDGTYFSHEAYVLTSASASQGRLSFVITCTAADSTRSDAPSRPAAMTLRSEAANGYVPTFSVAP